MVQIERDLLEKEFQEEDAKISERRAKPSPQEQVKEPVVVEGGLAGLGSWGRCGVLRVGFIFRNGKMFVRSLEVKSQFFDL